MPLTSTSVEWLSRLVQIPSVTPMHAGPMARAPGEAAIAEFIAQQFRAFGGEVIVEEVHPNRPNVYGIWRNPSSSKWIGLDCHTDTVGVENMHSDPFDGAVREGKVWGRGAVDDKASLAIALALLDAMHHQDRKPAHNLIVAAVADEEMSLGGAFVFADWLRKNKLVLDELVVAEPTLCAPCNGHKGVSRLTCHIKGISAHTSQPHLGKNAIGGAAKVIQAFEAEHARLLTVPPTPVGCATLTVSMISGGRAFNIVPDLCSVSVDRRIVAGEDSGTELDKLADLARAATDLPMKIEKVVDTGAFYQSADSAMTREFTRFTGHAPIIVPFGTDASAYELGVTHRNLLVFGPGSIDQAHGAVEWVEISQIEKAAAAYAAWWGL